MELDMPVQLVCQQCGNSFSVQPKDSNKKYCSPACYRGYEALHGRESQKVTPIVFSCKTCEKPFQRGPGELRHYRKVFGKDPLYCSRECSHIGRTQIKDKKCPVCGNTFTTAGVSLNRA